MNYTALQSILRTLPIFCSNMTNPISLVLSHGRGLTQHHTQVSVKPTLKTKMETLKDNLRIHKTDASCSIYP